MYSTIHPLFKACVAACKSIVDLPVPLSPAVLVSTSVFGLRHRASSEVGRPLESLWARSTRCGLHVAPRLCRYEVMGYRRALTENDGLFLLIDTRLDTVYPLGEVNGGISDHADH